MSTDPQSLRRSRSTGDIPGFESARPDLVRISPNSRHSESHPNPSNGASLPSSRTLTNEPQSSTTDTLAALQAPLPSQSRIGNTQVEEGVDEPTRATSPERPNVNRAPHRRRRSLYSTTLAFFGFGRNASRARRELVYLIWALSAGFAQVLSSFDSSERPGRICSILCTDPHYSRCSYPLFQDSQSHISRFD